MTQATHFTDKPQPVWQAILKSLGFVALFEGTQLFLAYIVQFALLFRAGADLSQSDLQDYLLDNFYAVLYETMFLAAGLFLLVVMLVYAFRPRGIPAGTGLQKCGGPDLFAGLFLGFGAFFLAGWLMQLMDLLPAVHDSAESYQEEYEVIEDAIARNGRPWVDFLYTVVGAPVVEEVLCRGLVLRQFRRATSDWAAIFISAAVFAVIHGNLYQMAFTLPLGILLGYLAARADSVLPTILLHAAFNGSNYLVVIWQYLGLEEDSTAAIVIAYAVQAFLMLSIIIGALLLWASARNRPPLSRGFRRPAPAAPVPGAQGGAFPYPPYGGQSFPPVPPQNTPYPGVTIPVAPFQTQVPTEGATMAAPEFLVVGLGNPGANYASTRHNAGFIAMDYIALREGLDLSRIRFKGLAAEKEIDGHKVLFIKPQTFMNLSGQSVREAAAFYHIPPEKVLVLVDDVNFEPGVLRIRREGSAGGHNGLKSIIENLGTEAFPRVRLGVGAVPPERDLIGWVLGTLPDGDMDKLVGCLEDVRRTVRAFIAGDLDSAMNAYNGKTANSR